MPYTRVENEELLASVPVNGLKRPLQYKGFSYLSLCYRERLTSVPTAKPEGL